MVPYKNLSGDSGVAAYELGSDFIRIEFVDGHRYRYTSANVGSENVEKMKHLAIEGRGLSTFINQNKRVREGFVRE